jgi:hypothetical protein
MLAIIRGMPADDGAPHGQGSQRAYNCFMMPACDPKRRMQKEH